MSGTLAALSAGLQTAVNQVQTDLGAFSNLSTATTDQLATLSADLSAATVAAQAVQAAVDGALVTAAAPALFVSGTPQTAMLAAVEALVQQATAMPTAFDCANRLQRMVVCVGAATTGT